MALDTEQEVLSVAKGLYDTARKNNVTFAKGPVVTFEAITQKNAAWVHEAAVQMGATCDKHNHSKPSQMTAQQVLMEAEKRVRAAEAEKVKFAADKKRVLGLTPFGQQVLANQEKDQPDLSTHMSAHEAEKARLRSLSDYKPKDLFTRRGDASESGY